MSAPAPVLPRHQVTSPPPAGVGGAASGLVVPSTGPIRLAAEHFAAATAFLLAGALALPWIAPQLAAGLYPDQRVAGVTHLFTLGWLTTTMFGALYQLLPVALGAPVASERAGHVGVAAFAPGVALFAAGVMRGDTRLHHVGLCLVAIGVATTVGNVAATLRRATHRDATWTAVAVALTALVATFGLGVALLHNLHTGFLGGLRSHVVAIHLHVAIVGWALVLIVGMSQRLLPMFLLAHGVDTRWTTRALALLPASLPPLVVGLAAGVPWLAWAAVAIGGAGVACFLVQARLFFRARVRRRLDPGMRHVAVALGFLGVAALLAPAVLAVGAGLPGIGARLAVAYVVVGLLGGVVIYVLGHFHKIVPFLAWIARYQRRVGREPVPTVAELTSARAAYAELALVAGGVAALAVGVLAGSVAITRVGAAGFALGVTTLVAQMARLAWRTLR